MALTIKVKEFDNVVDLFRLNKLMKNKEQHALEEAYTTISNKKRSNNLKVKSYYNMKPFKSFHSLDPEVQDLLSTIAADFQIPNLIADQWVRDAMAAAYQSGEQRSK